MKRDEQWALLDRAEDLAVLIATNAESGNDPLSPAAAVMYRDKDSTWQIGGRYVLWENYFPDGDPTPPDSMVFMCLEPALRYEIIGRSILEDEISFPELPLLDRIGIATRRMLGRPRVYKCEDLNRFSDFLDGLESYLKERGVGL